MKRDLLAKLLILPLILLIFVALCPAQDPPPAASPNGQNTEIMGEDDRLPFMQNQETQAAQEPGSGGLLLKTLGAMMLVVGLIFGGAWGAKKLGFGNFNAKNAADEMNLAILTSVSLGSGRTISTVRFGERVLLVGSTAQNFTLLAEESKPDAVSQVQTRSVAELLDEEDIAFETEFAKAEARLNFENGGQNL
jgi:flagellar biogenesis protein FliO